MQPKDYDNTLVRCAGNIAAALVSRDPTGAQKGSGRSFQSHDDEVADRAVAMAQAIIARARKLQAKEQ